MAERSPQEGMTTSESLSRGTTSSAQRERDAQQRGAQQEAEDRRRASRVQQGQAGQASEDEGAQAEKAQEKEVDVEGFIKGTDDHLNAIHEAAMQLENSDELASFLNSLAAVNTSKVQLRDALLERQALQRETMRQDQMKEQVQQDVHTVADKQAEKDI